MSSSRAKSPSELRGVGAAFWVCTRPCVRYDGERDTGPGFTKTCCVSLDRLILSLALSLTFVKWKASLEELVLACWLLGGLLGSFRNLMFTVLWYPSCDSA